jgi:hypothetical protein
MRIAIRLLTLATCATALMMVLIGTPAKAESSSNKKHDRHVQRSRGFSEP